MRLDLHDNPITGEAAPQLAATLSKQTRLAALVLNDTSLGDEGVGAVCAALAGAAPQLEVGGLPLGPVLPRWAGLRRAGCT